ncbi:MAG: hypothetical protein D6795_10140 [Deltaproteobacteria bacterium]|nr:MAG: hypothetical protein D6795_10140 [Deltaproteobacteria bacterium]
MEAGGTPAADPDEANLMKHLRMVLLLPLYLLVWGSPPLAAQEGKSYPFSLTVPKAQREEASEKKPARPSSQRRTKIYDESDRYRPPPPRPAPHKQSPRQRPRKEKRLPIRNLKSYLRHEESELSGLRYTVIYVEGDVENPTGRIVTDATVEITLRLESETPTLTVNIPVIMPGERSHFKESYSSSIPLRSVHAEVVSYETLSPASRDAIPYWVEALYDAQEAKRALSIMKRLGRIRDPSVFPPIVAKLSDDDARVSGYARKVLERFARQKKLRSALEEALYAGLLDATPQGRRTIFEMLGRLGAQRAVYPLLVFLRNADAQDREAAGRCLEALGKEAIPPLLSVHGSKYVAEEQRWALHHLGATAVNALIELRSQEQGFDPARYEGMAPEAAIDDLLAGIPEGDPQKRRKELEWARSLLHRASEPAVVAEGEEGSETSEGDAAAASRAPRVIEPDTGIYLGIAIGIFLLVVLAGVKFGI